VFAVDGALMVVDGQRVGRIVGDGIEWLAKAIPTPPQDGRRHSLRSSRAPS
jgi:hypothetical protein